MNHKEDFPYLLAYWDAGSVLVGSIYEIRYVSIILWKGNDSFVIIDPLKHLCVFDRLTVEKTGVNWYTVTCTVDGKNYNARFAIVGVTEKHFQTADLLITGVINEDETIDLTEKLTPYFWNESFGIVVSWNNFYNAIKELNINIEKFKIRVPANSGMNYRKVTEWIVEVKNASVSASLEKVWENEIDEENGESNNN